MNRPGKNFLIEFIAWIIQQNKTFGPIFSSQYLFIYIIKTNRKIDNILSSNKYEIGKDLPPQNKNTSHIKTMTNRVVGQKFINKSFDVRKKNDFFFFCYVKFILNSLFV